MDKQCSSCGGFCGEVCEREEAVRLLRDEKYDLIDKFLRNYLDDEWYPTYSNALERIYHTPYKPRKLWVSLTDEEIAQAVGSPIDEVYLSDFRKVEAKLKEKNNA